MGECILVTDKEQALSEFKEAHDSEQPFNLVCLDMILPDSHGREILEAIRDLEQTWEIIGEKSTKIIVTTGVTDPATVVSAFQCGCAAYVTKPIDKIQLLREVRGLGLYPAMFG
jgi:two-component system chemotaxis response regulator CheY